MRRGWRPLRNAGALDCVKTSTHEGRSQTSLELLVLTAHHSPVDQSSQPLSEHNSMSICSATQSLASMGFYRLI